MLGYSLIVACGVIMTLEAMTGFLVIAHPQIRARPLKGLRLTFIVFALAGVVALTWALLRVKESYWQAPGVVDIEMSTNQADVQLQRVASLLGVDPHQPDYLIGDTIVKRLSAHEWHLTPVQAKAFGQALDETPAQDRFPVVVRCIPGSADSVSFADDVVSALRSHGWVVQSRRDFGINRNLAGIMIAVPSSVKTESEVPMAAKMLIVMLEKAGFTPYGGVMKDLGPGEFQLVIGKGPR